MRLLLRPIALLLVGCLLSASAAEAVQRSAIRPVVFQSIADPCSTQALSPLAAVYFHQFNVQSASNLVNSFHNAGDASLVDSTLRHFVDRYGPLDKNAPAFAFFAFFLPLAAFECTTRDSDRAKELHGLPDRTELWDYVDIALKAAEGLPSDIAAHLFRLYGTTGPVFGTVPSRMKKLLASMRSGNIPVEPNTMLEQRAAMILRGIVTLWLHRPYQSVDLAKIPYGPNSYSQLRYSYKNNPVVSRAVDFYGRTPTQADLLTEIEKYPWRRHQDMTGMHHEFGLDYRTWNNALKKNFEIRDAVETRVKDRPALKQQPSEDTAGKDPQVTAFREKINALTGQSKLGRVISISRLPFFRVVDFGKGKVNLTETELAALKDAYEEVLGNPPSPDRFAILLMPFGVSDNPFELSRLEKAWLWMVETPWIWPVVAITAASMVYLMARYVVLRYRQTKIAAGIRAVYDELHTQDIRNILQVPSADALPHFHGARETQEHLLPVTLALLRPIHKALLKALQKPKQQLGQLHTAAEPLRRIRDYYNLLLDAPLDPETALDPALGLDEIHTRSARKLLSMQWKGQWMYIKIVRDRLARLYDQLIELQLKASPRRLAKFSNEVAA